MWPKVQATSQYVNQAVSLDSAHSESRGTQILSDVFDVSADFGFAIQLNKPIVHLLIDVVGHAEQVSAASTKGVLNQSTGAQPQRAAYAELSQAWTLLKKVPAQCPKPKPVQTKKPTPPPSRKPKPAPPAAPSNVLFSQTGSGIQTTDYFYAPANWSIDWSFDCSSFGSSGNFIVSVYSGSGELQDVAVNALSSGDSGTAYEHQGGSVYLQINSECDWQVTAYPD